MTDWNEEFKKITIGKQIGCGTFGDVYIAQWKISENEEKTIAVKKIRPFLPQKIENELKFLSTLKHENLVMFYGACKDENNITNIFLEYSEDGSLYDFLHDEKYKNCEISYLGKLGWMYQIAKGTAYLHENNIAHRDLNPNNILLFDNKYKIKLCDFGTLKEIETQNTAYVGTRAYMAPELLNTDYNVTCDVYSYGIIFWEVITRKKPYENIPINEQFLNKVAKGLRPPLDDIKTYTNSKHIKGIIDICLKKDPTERPTMKGLSFTLSMNPYSFGDREELITKITPLPEVDDKCFR